MLLAGVDIERIADIVRYRDARTSVALGDHALRIAYLAPAALARRGGDGAVGRQLHDAPCRLRAAQPRAPVGKQGGKAPVVSRNAGIRSTLIPGDTRDVRLPQRCDHRIVERARAIDVVPWHARRRTVQSLGDRVTPAGTQRNAAAIGKGDSHRLGRAGHPAERVDVVVIDGDDVTSCGQRTGGQGVDPHLRCQAAAANSLAIHPGPIRIVDRAQRQRRRAPRLRGRNIDIAAIPEHAVIIGECGHTPMFEVGHRRHRPPVEPRPRLPRLMSCCIARSLPPPRLPRGHRARIGRGGIARVQRQQVGGIRHTGTTQRGVAHPRADPRPAPARMDRADRHIGSAAQRLHHVIAGGRKAGHALGCRRDPAGLVGKAGQRRRGRHLRYGEQPQSVVGGAMRVGDHVLRARDGHLHVALPRTEKHIAHQQVADHRSATRSGDGQVVRAAGGQRGKLRGEAAVAVGASGDAVPGERHHNRFAGCRIARQVDGLAALDHTMIGQDAI